MNKLISLRVNESETYFHFGAFYNLIFHGLKTFKGYINLKLSHFNHVYTYSFQLIKSFNSELMPFFTKITKK